MFCHEQITQLRDIQSQLDEANASLFVIGNGTVEHAADTREQLESPFVFLVDPERVSYRTMGMRKDIRSSLNPRMFFAAFRAWRKGHHQEKTKGDPFQQGGALIVRQGGAVAFEYIGRFAGDHPDPKEIVEAVSA